MTIYTSPTGTIIGYKCTANGTFLTKFGTEGSGSSQFILPEGVGVDISTGLVYVADTGNYRIQVFRPVASSVNVA